MNVRADGLPNGKTGAAGEKPLICIVYASADFTGAFVAVRREAEIMRDEARFMLVLPRRHNIPDEQLVPFESVVQLPMMELGERSVGAVFRYVGATIASSVALRRLVAKRRCDRVQMNCFTTQHAALLRLLGFRGRIVTWVRTDPSRLRTMGSLSLRLARRSSDAVVAVSRHVRDLLPFRECVETIYEPVDERQNIGASDEPALVLLGSYVPVKGHDVAIAAFHLVADRHPAARLVFHGNRTGPASDHYVDALQRVATNGAGAARIEFCDFVPLAEGLTGKRAVLVASRSESFSLACQDAAAHGLPVIATRCGGPEEIVEDDRTGYLINVDDVEALAERMHRLLSDPELARTMGAAGRELMRERFPADRFRQELREVFAL